MRSVRLFSYLLAVFIVGCVLFHNVTYAKPYDYANKVIACYEGNINYPYVAVFGKVGFAIDVAAAVPIDVQNGNTAYRAPIKAVDLFTGKMKDGQDLAISKVGDTIVVFYDLDDLKGSMRTYTLSDDNFDTAYDTYMLLSQPSFIKDICYEGNYNYPCVDLGKQFANMLDISSSIPLDTERGRGYTVALKTLVYGTGKISDNGRLVMFRHGKELWHLFSRNGETVRKKFIKVNDAQFPRDYYAFRLAMAECRGK